MLHGGAFLHLSQIVKQAGQVGGKFQEVMEEKKPQHNQNGEIQLLSGHHHPMITLRQIGMQGLIGNKGG